MSQSYNKKTFFHNHLLSGWSKIFGKKTGQTTSEAGASGTNKKPFPPNHFFSAEELIFLSRNQAQNTLLERWALEMSLWAKERCTERDKNAPGFFPAVQWQDGLLSTWINSKPHADDMDQQADRLCQLQLAGYELSESFIRMIDGRACRTLVGSLFTDEVKDNPDQPRYMKVKDVIDKEGEPLSLRILIYEKISHKAAYGSHITYKDLKKSIDAKHFTVLSNEALRKWNEEATVRDEVETNYLSLIELTKRSNHLQGMFPVNNSIYVCLDGKTYYPKAWSLYEGKIRIDFSSSAAEGRAYVIENEESYLFVDVLDYIEKTLEERTLSRDLASMVKIFGNPVKEDGTCTLLSADKSICTIDGVEVNRVDVTSSEEVIASNADSSVTVPLTPSDKCTLLKNIIQYGDSLIKEFKRSQSRSTDKIVKGLLQEKLDAIHEGLSAYSKATERHPLDSLWQDILTRFEVLPSSCSGTAASPPAASIVQPAPSSVNGAGVQELTVQAASDSSTSSSQNAEEPTPDDNQQEEPVSIPRGYIQLQPSPAGRWHTAEMQRKEAYRVYGMLLSKKLKRQLADGHNPWVSKKMMLPRNTEGNVHTGTNAIMLALWMEENDFELPFFITASELQEKGYGISEEAESLYILQGEGAERVYNIGQTSFPVSHRRAYESLKMNMAAMERKSTSGYQFLDANNFSKVKLLHDGKPGLSLYDYTSGVIHIAPKEEYDNTDDYYRDLAVAMVESTRDVDFDTLRLDSYLFESLVSHLGSGIISQRCRFDATNPEYSKIWRERLEDNPSYTKRILEQSETSSSEILQSSLS